MNDVVFQWIVDSNLKHAIMIDDLAKNTEHRLSALMLNWMNDTNHESEE